MSLLGNKIANGRLLERCSFLTIFQDQDTVSLISSPKSKTFKNFTPNFSEGQAKQTSSRQLLKLLKNNETVLPQKLCEYHEQRFQKLTALY